MLHLLPEPLRRKLPNELWINVINFILPTECIYKTSLDRFQHRKLILENTLFRNSQFCIGDIYKYGLLNFSINIVTFLNGKKFYKTIYFGIDNDVTDILFSINDEIIFIP